MRAPETASAWTPEQLAAIDGTGEVEVLTRRGDGTLRPARTVWIVRDGDALYVRSVNGAAAAWYRGVQTRHQGHLTAGRITRDVTFTEAGAHPGSGAGQALDDALDEAYRAKYGRSSSAVARITAGAARATTLRVDPA